MYSTLWLWCLCFQFFLEMNFCSVKTLRVVSVCSFIKGGDRVSSRWNSSYSQSSSVWVYRQPRSLGVPLRHRSLSLDHHRWTRPENPTVSQGLLFRPDLSEELPWNRGRLVRRSICRWGWVDRFLRRGSGPGNQRSTKIDCDLSI